VAPVLAVLVVAVPQAIIVQPPELMVLGAEAEAEAIKEDLLAENRAEVAWLLSLIQIHLMIYLTLTLVLL